MISWRMLLWAATVGVLASVASAKEPVLTIVETPLTKKPLTKTDQGLPKYWFNNDATKVAYIESDGQHQWVMVNNERVMPQKAASARVGKFTKNGLPTYYFTDPGRANSMHIVFDGKVSNAYSGLGDDHSKGAVAYSNDGTHMLAIMGAASSDSPSDGRTVFGGGSYVVFDGKEYPLCDEFFQYQISDNSKQWGYIGRLGDEFFWVINGVKQKSYPNMVNAKAMFSNTDQGFAYLAQTANKAYIPVVNGVDVGTYGNISDFVLSPDGKHYAFLTNKDGKTGCLVSDGKEEVDADTVSNLEYTSDSKLVRLVKKGDKTRLLLDGVETKDEYPPGACDVVVSPTLGRIAVKVKVQEGGKTREGWILDGKATELYEGMVQAPQFSPSGKNFAFRVRRADNSWFYVALGKQFPSMTGAIRDAKFSPDETRFVVVSRFQNSYGLALDGVMVGEFCYLGYMDFTTDSRHIIYQAAKVKGNPLHIVVDNVESKEVYDDIGCPTYPTGTNSYRLVMLRGLVPIRVDMTITGNPPTAMRPVAAGPSSRSAH